MSWKSNLINKVLGYLSKTEKKAIPRPQSILVIRNNDLGDLLVITPLFQALKELFPETLIYAGVGDWAKPVLENNPYITEALTLNAPWYNQYIQGQGYLEALKYILFSPEIENIREKKIDLAIDVLGSNYGSMLMLNAEIPYRIGVSGFAGGDKSCQISIDYNSQRSVGASALEFAKVLGSKSLPKNKPQLYLNQDEIHWAKQYWQNLGIDKAQRLIIAPGAGFMAKRWDDENYRQLCTYLNQNNYSPVVIGTTKEAGLVNQIFQTDPGIINLCGKLNLRQTFALISQANMLISNSSMAIHAAAAFDIDIFCTLGPYFKSKQEHDCQWGYSQRYHSYDNQAADLQSLINTLKESQQRL